MIRIDCGWHYFRDSADTSEYDQLPIVFSSEHEEPEEIPGSEWDRITALHKEGDDNADGVN